MVSDSQINFNSTIEKKYGTLCYLTKSANPSGAPRPPFDDLIRRMICLHSYGQTRQKPPVIVSVDIPSGWHVEEGDVDGEGIKPDMLVCF